MPPTRITLPESPEGSPRAGLLSPWQPPRRSQSSGRSSPYVQHRSSALRDDLINNAEKLQRRIFSTYKRMSVLQRVLAGLALVTAMTFGILFFIYNERIFGWLEPLADRWKKTTGGWIILWAITFMTAFPPMIGYSTCGTTAGFVYGVGEGWLILATASVAGSFCSFIVSRTVLRKYVERMVANDKRFAALTLTLKHDGLKLLCLIRLCPLPYSLSNGAMSTFPTVHPAMYALATALVSPKLLIHAFIGSRLAAIAKNREKMSAGTQAINWISIVVGGVVGACTGYYIYQRTMSRARQLEEEEASSVRTATRRTGQPPREFADDPEAQPAVETLTREDEDAVDYFDDSPNDAQEYRDELTDDEDVFRRGDGDEEDGIGLHAQKK